MATQLIYGAKTKQPLPRLKLPGSFSLSVNLKQFSITEESVKVIEEIVLPYFVQQCQELEKFNQTATLIMNIFCG